LGPFADSKYIQFDDAAMFNLFHEYRKRTDLQSKFPEVLANDDYSNLLCWAKKSKKLQEYYSFYEERCS